MGIKTVITLYPKRQNKNINERNVYMYNLYNYILFSVFLRKTRKKFSSLPLKSLMCENVVNFYIYLTSCSLKSPTCENESLYYVFSIQCTRPCL